MSHYLSETTRLGKVKKEEINLTGVSLLFVQMEDLIVRAIFVVNRILKVNGLIGISFNDRWIKGILHILL